MPADFSDSLALQVSRNKSIGFKTMLTTGRI
jgi:hypothetical protein